MMWCMKSMPTGYLLLGLLITSSAMLTARHAAKDLAGTLRFRRL
jgi:hypothetical protein